MSRKLFYIFFICLLSLFQTASAQDCEFPQPFIGNTGSNMTVMLTSGVVDAFPISSDSPYVVAFSPDGLIVGSASVAASDLIGGQQSLAVWGNDTATPEIDGAIDGQELSFQLIDGTSLYDLDLSFAGLNSFTANGLLPAIAVTVELNCSDSDSDSDSSLLCDFPLPQPFNGNTGQNMTVFFTSESIDSLPTGSDSPYIVAISPGGLVVGSASFASSDLIDGQQSIAVWGDDTQTPELDGLLANDILTFQLVVGDSLFDLDLTYAGSNSFSASGYVPVIAASAVLNCHAPSEGCTNDLACNYDSLAEVDDGSCLYNDICGVCDGSGPNEFYDCDGTCISDTDADGVCDELEIQGCQDPIADNYDVNATDPDSCEYLGCTDTNYFEYDSIATINDGSCETFIIYGCTDQDYL